MKATSQVFETTYHEDEVIKAIRELREAQQGEEEAHRRLVKARHKFAEVVAASGFESVVNIQPR